MSIIQASQPEFIKIHILKILGLENLRFFKKYEEFQLKTDSSSKIFTIDSVNQINFVHFLQASNFTVPFNLVLLGRRKESPRFQKIGQINTLNLSFNFLNTSNELNIQEVVFAINNDPTNQSVKCQIIIIYLPKDFKNEPLQEFTMSEFQYKDKKSHKSPKLLLNNEIFSLYRVYSNKTNSKYLLKKYKIENIQKVAKSKEKLLTVNDISNIKNTQNFETLLPIVGFIRQKIEEKNEMTFNQYLKELNNKQKKEVSLEQYMQELNCLPLSDDEDDAEIDLVWCIIYPFIEHVTLDELIHSEQSKSKIKDYNNSSKTSIMYGIANAISYLHNYGIAHRHLSPSNILIDTKSLDVKLFDYEVSKEIVNKDLNGVYYNITNDKYLKSSHLNEDVFADDVFDLGLIYFEIATGMKKKNENDDDDDLIYLSSNLRLVFSKMIDVDPYERPQVDEIIYLIKTGNFVIYDTRMKEVMKYIKKIEEKQNCENIHNSHRFVMETAKESPSKFALFYLYKENDKNENVLSMFDNLKNDIFVKSLYGISAMNESNEFDKDLINKMNLFSNETSNPDYRFCLMNFDLKEKDDDNDLINAKLWWILQQIKTGMRNASLFFSNFKKGEINPKYLNHLDKIVELFESENDPNSDVLMSKAILFQYMNKDIESLINQAIKDNITISLSSSFLNPTEKFIDKKEIAVVHNSVDVFAELSSYYYYEKNDLDECSKYSKLGAVNKNAVCEFIRGLYYLKKNKIDDAKYYIKRALKHGYKIKNENLDDIKNQLSGIENEDDEIFDLISRNVECNSDQEPSLSQEEKSDELSVSKDSEETEKQENGNENIEDETSYSLQNQEDESSNQQNVQNEQEDDRLIADRINTLRLKNVLKPVLRVQQDSQPNQPSNKQIVSTSVQVIDEQVYTNNKKHSTFSLDDEVDDNEHEEESNENAVNYDYELLSTISIDDAEKLLNQQNVQNDQEDDRLIADRINTLRIKNVLKPVLRVQQDSQPNQPSIKQVVSTSVRVIDEQVFGNNEKLSNISPEEESLNKNEITNGDEMPWTLSIEEAENLINKQEEDKQDEDKNRQEEEDKLEADLDEEAEQNSEDEKMNDNEITNGDEMPWTLSTEEAENLLNKQEEEDKREHQGLTIKIDQNLKEKSSIDNETDNDNINDRTANHLNGPNHEPSKQSNEEENENDLSQFIESLIQAENSTELILLLKNKNDFNLTNEVFNKIYKRNRKFYSQVIKKGVEFEDPVSLHKLAVSLIFSRENGTNNQTAKSNFERARDLLQKSINHDFLLSYFTLARLLHEFFKEDELAFKTATQGQIKGEKYCNCLVGRFISRGIGTKKEFCKGIELMLDSGCKDYYERFATDIGIYYNMKKDDQKAHNWFERAFQLQISEATVNNLGVLYMEGIGVSKDVKKAEELFSVGIKRGFSSSFYHLGFIMMEKNQEKIALNYFKIAADKGNVYAKDFYHYLINEKMDKFMDNLEINDGSNSSQIPYSTTFIQENKT